MTQTSARSAAARSTRRSRIAALTAATAVVLSALVGVAAAAPASAETSAAADGTSETVPTADFAREVSGKVGQPYAFQYATAGQSYEMNYGALPDGLQLSASGLITGTPTRAGTFNFTVQFGSGSSCGDNGCHAWVSLKADTITIAPVDSAPTFTAYAPPMETPLGQPYSYQFAATGSPAPSFTIADGTLPTGLTLDANGLLHGTPNETGGFRFKVRASNGVGDDAIAGALGLSVLSAPTFTAQTPPAGRVGTAFSYQFASTGYPGTPTYSVVGALPAGLSLNANGTLTGTPTKAGTTTFTVRATNTAGSTDASISVTVNPSPQTGHVTINPAPASVAPGAWEDDTNIRVFAEQQNTVLPAAITVGGKTIPAGTKVNVYYATADPVGSANTAHPYAGSLWFGTQVLGIASTTADLQATSSLGATGVTYPTSVDQGLETGDTATVNGTTVTMNWNAYNTTDAIRIITLAP